MVHFFQAWQDHQDYDWNREGHVTHQDRGKAKLELDRRKEDQEASPDHNVRCHHEDVIDGQKRSLKFLLRLVDIDRSKSPNNGRNQG